MVGAVLEWYEFAVYGALAATVFAGQFFPARRRIPGILLAFGTQAVGFVARPLGGISSDISAIGSAASRCWSPPT